ncbi:MAG: dihydrolipoyl dehydrogenase [Dehalococcoidia bacterium]|nr:MAG: dihydrolipoyl dehydrogenase [Dehalococcoidia bacterium]
METKSIVVVGGGPAGYTAAIRAAQLGAKVILIENIELGGACLNRACIPTKFLLRSVEIYQFIKDSARYGINVPKSYIDFDEIQSRKNSLVSTLVSGLTSVIEMNGIEVIRGHAKLISKRSLEVMDRRGGKYIVDADKIILATGSRVKKLDIPGAYDVGVMFAENILNLNDIPESIVIIGGGIVGVEMATILANLGCHVNIVEIMPHILPGEDSEITAVLAGALKKDGVRIYTGAVVNRIDANDKGKQVVITIQNTKKLIEAETVAIATGYEPYFDKLGLEESGVAVIGDRVEVNENMETSVSGIYAAGDVTGGIMLAYVAMAEGRIAAENALGGHLKMNYGAVPRCIFTLPEVACVGLPEDRARLKGYHIECGRFPFAANSAANILGERRGMVKIVSDKENDRIIGVHIIGAGAVDLIPEATLAVKLGSTLDDIKNTLHAHPTLSEVFWEAILDINGQTIHLKR